MHTTQLSVLQSNLRVNRISMFYSWLIKTNKESSDGFLKKSRATKVKTWREHFYQDRKCNHKRLNFSKSQMVSQWDRLTKSAVSSEREESDSSLTVLHWNSHLPKELPRSSNTHLERKNGRRGAANKSLLSQLRWDSLGYILLFFFSSPRFPQPRGGPSL